MKSLSELEIVFVDSVCELHLMMNDLEDQSTTPDWHLNVDLEGINLCRHGEICVGQFAGKGSRVVYVVDFVAMDPFVEEPRLKSMLSSESVLKLLFDPRNDADALGSLYNVQLRGVLCLQVADVAYRLAKGWRCRFVRGLAPAMQSVPMSDHDRSEMERIKRVGKALFCPELGGTYEVFKERPLEASMRKYCAVDVFFFDEMKAALYDTLPAHWKTKVTRASSDRVKEWTKAGYVGKGRDRAKSPF
jgi:exonuclease 3'-5' domain-containing protein 1